MSEAQVGVEEKAKKKNEFIQKSSICYDIISILDCRC